MKTISGSRENISQKLGVLGHDEESRVALVNKVLENKKFVDGDLEEAA
ncbi:hypothetical protein [Acetomicrobium sp. UBA5826]|nr:hypothetical protein [Acetomicrobium sp. UBA5826]